MKQRPHIIEIDRIVLDGVDLRDRRLVRALVERETTRVLLHSDLADSSVVSSGKAIAGEVGRSVEGAVKGGVGSA
jgi:hypothetical protein